MKKIVLKVFFLCFFATTTLLAQHNYDSYNRFGIGANLTHFTIHSNEINTISKTGFLGGFQTRGSFYNNFDLVLGLNITSNKVGVEVINSLSQIEEAEYDLLAAQLNLLLSYKLIGENLTMEFGPVLMYNENMKLANNTQGNYLVNGLPVLTAKDLEDITQFNFNAAVGLTGGFEHFRFSLQYQYGINNVFNKIKDNTALDKAIKGHLGVFVGGVVFYL